jgi:hypothetical protein
VYSIPEAMAGRQQLLEGRQCLPARFIASICRCVRARAGAGPRTHAAQRRGRARSGDRDPGADVARGRRGGVPGRARTQRVRAARRARAAAPQVAGAPLPARLARRARAAAPQVAGVPRPGRPAAAGARRQPGPPGRGSRGAPLSSRRRHDMGCGECLGRCQSCAATAPLICAGWPQHPGGQTPFGSQGWFYRCTPTH